MKYFLKATCLVTLVLSSASAQAWPGIFDTCGDYQQELWTLERESINSLAAHCELVPLKLIAVSTADGVVAKIWTGGYQRLANVSDTYRVDHYDSCSGDYEGTEEKTNTVEKELEFSIVNPNIAPDSPSYIMNGAPLLPSEAQAELPAALQHCEMASATETSSH
jgi:hypothetical protein